MTETRDYSDKLVGLHSLLGAAQEALEKGWDPEKKVSEALRGQVATLERQLDVKDVQNEKLKTQVTDAQNGQRREITATIEEFHKYLEHMAKIEAQTEQKILGLLDERQEADKVSNERELADHAQIDALADNVQNLSFKIRELEATNKEEECLKLRSLLVTTEADLTNAKKNLVSHVESVKVMEETFGERLSCAEAKFDHKDELSRLKLENERLTTENAALLESKTTVEADLNDRLEQA